MGQVIRLETRQVDIVRVRERNGMTSSQELGSPSVYANSRVTSNRGLFSTSTPPTLSEVVGVSARPLQVAFP